MRTDNIYIQAESFIFDLRVARRLFREHSSTLESSTQVAAALELIHSIIEVIEHGPTVLSQVAPHECSAEARLGSDADGRIR